MLLNFNERVMLSRKISFRIINSLTIYRLLAAPFLLLLAFTGSLVLLKWLVTLSFLTDAVDGPLSRKYKVASVFGSRLDSAADNATMLASALSLLVVFPEFILEQWKVIALIAALFCIQTVAALLAYKRITSFHTYLAKVAAVSLACFFILFFFEVPYVQFVFYAAAIITCFELIEEIILVLVLPEWKTDVKGLYWVMRSQATGLHHQTNETNKHL